MGEFDLGDQLPRAGNAITRMIGRGIYRWRGWRIEGSVPNEKKLLAVVAPHTSNLDFFVGMCAVWALSIRASWLAKHTLFRGPVGVVLRHFGGIPIDRTLAHGVVDQIVEAYVASERLVVAITPEGTRGKVHHWKTGFCYIAVNANVPMAPVYFDYPRKVLGFGPTFRASGDLDGDIARLRDYFSQFTGRKPELQT